MPLPHPAPDLPLAGAAPADRLADLVLAEVEQMAERLAAGPDAAPPSQPPGAQARQAARQRATLVALIGRVQELRAGVWAPDAVLDLGPLAQPRGRRLVPGTASLDPHGRLCWRGGPGDRAQIWVGAQVAGSLVIAVLALGVLGLIPASPAVALPLAAMPGGLLSAWFGWRARSRPLDLDRHVPEPEITRLVERATELVRRAGAERERLWAESLAAVAAADAQLAAPPGRPALS